jgi:integrase
VARTTGVRQRCEASCPARCRQHKWGFHVELPADDMGKRRQITRGGFDTMTEAAQARAAVLAAHRAGTTPQVDRRETMRTYLERWYARKVEAGALRASTASSYRGHLDRYLLPHLGAVRVQDLRAHHVEAMLSAVRSRETGRPVGAATQVRILATLRSAIRDGVRRGDVAHDHTLHVTMPRPVRPRVRPWPAATFWEFADRMAAEEEHSAARRLHALVLVATGTGLRLGEVCGLRWDDVDLAAGRLTVRQQAQQVGSVVTYGPPKTRSGEDRAVPLLGWVPDTLRAHRAQQVAERLAWGEAWTDSGLVFTRPGGAPLVPFSASQAFSRLVRAYGMPPLTFHGLRHLGASILLDGGVPLAAVSRILGHSSVQITGDIYGHLVMDDAVRDAAQRALSTFQDRGVRAVP